MRRRKKRRIAAILLLVFLLCALLAAYFQHNVTKVLIAVSEATMRAHTTVAINDAVYYTLGDGVRYEDLVTVERNDAGDEARAAHADAYRVLAQAGVPRAGCVLHCFGEDRATMERFLELGCHIAFGGAATFKRNEHIREAFAACPRERLLFETDCPYMAPEPIRGLECEPAMMPTTVTATPSRAIAQRVRVRIQTSSCGQLGITPAVCFFANTGRPRADKTLTHAVQGHRLTTNHY